MTSPGNEERRPGGGGATNLNFTSDSTAPAGDMWAVWLDGWTIGRAEGISRGRELADAEAAARHRAAAQAVLGICRAPEVDRDEAAARRARIDARFGGESG